MALGFGAAEATAIHTHFGDVPMKSSHDTAGHGRDVKDVNTHLGTIPVDRAEVDAKHPEGQAVGCGFYGNC